MKNGKLTKQQKKDQLIIAVLAVVAVVALVFCINASNNSDSQVAVADTTAATTTTTAATTTTQPAPATTTAPPVTTTEAAPEENEPTEAVTEEEITTEAPAVDETEEILKVVTKAVKSLKADDANFKGHKVQNINMKLVDSSVPAVNNIVNSVLSTFIKEEIYDYDFTNGVSVDPDGGGESKSNSIFPPGDCEFRLVKEGIASASKKQEGENTVYTIVLVPESSTLENPRPPHHNSAADTLDLSSVEIPIITLTRVDFDYPGATIAVTINPEGECVGYYEHLPLNGTGEGYGLGITGFGTIEGYLEETWDIEWK